MQAAKHSLHQSSLKGKGNILARSAVSLPHQRKKKTSGELEGGRQPPAPDPDLENS
jgi:hypothetical protein